MKPNFCLSLSSEGIRLLKRGSDGWLLVGEVALDSPDLGRALTTLRQNALALAPDGFQTKLLIPNDQIKYLALDSARVPDEDVAAALDQATPYALDDLSYDVSRGGGRTYAAAVARETLAEAEAFAVENGFAPICFAAVPDPFTFQGEVFFGPTVAALTAGIEVERDVAPVVVVGRVPLPKEATPRAASTDPDPVAEAAVPEPASDVAPASPAQDAATADAEPLANDEPVAAPDDAPEVGRDMATEPLDSPDAAAASQLPNDAKTGPDVVGDAAILPEFASRARALRADPPGTPPPPANPERVPTAPRITPKHVFQPGVDRQEPVFRRPVSEPVTRPVPSMAVQVGPGGSGPSLAGAARAIDASPATAGAQLNAVPPAAVDSPRITGLSEVAKPAHTVVNSGPALHDPAGSDLTYLPDAPDPALAASSADTQARPTVAAPTGGQFPSPRQAALAASAEPDSTGLTVFGGRKTAARSGVGRRPRFLALILTAVLLLFLAVVAAWAAFMSDDGLAGLFAPRTPTVAAGDVVVPVAIPDSGAAQPATVPDLTDNGVALNASGNMATEVPATGDESAADIADAASDGAIASGTGEVLSPAEANRVYAATGVWQRAPRLPLLPNPESSGDIVIAAVDQPVISPDATQLPVLAVSAPDAAITPPPPPPASGTVFELDAGGFVQATPEGTLTPSGAVVIAGKPPMLPQERAVPDVAVQTPLADPQAEPATSGGVVLASLRPSVRPGDLAPVAEPDVAATPAADDALAGFRPQLRPANLAPQPEPAVAATAVADPAPAPSADVAAIAAAIAATAPQVVSPVAGATRLAIASSRRPDDRPRNFSSVVTRATRASAQAAAVAPSSTAAPAAAPAPTQQAIAPSGPVAATAARAATVENAVNLHDVSLLGVSGTPSNRTALVRMGSGQLVKVRVGDRLDGGQVSAIGDSALNYVKRGRTLVLAMP